MISTNFRCHAPPDPTSPNPIYPPDTSHSIFLSPPLSRLRQYFTPYPKLLSISVYSLHVWASPFLSFSKIPTSLRSFRLTSPPDMCKSKPSLCIYLSANSCLYRVTRAGFHISLSLCSSASRHRFSYCTVGVCIVLCKIFFFPSVLNRNFRSGHLEALLPFLFPDGFRC